MLIRFADSIPINAPAGKVWEVLSKWQDPSDWVPQCLSCKLLDPPGITDGVGAMRRIQEEDQILTETAIIWEAPSRIAISVSGVPPVVKDVVTTFEVRPISTDTSSFSVTSCSATGLGIIGVLISPFAKRAQRAELRKLLAAMKYHVESGKRATHEDVKQVLGQQRGLQ